MGLILRSQRGAALILAIFVVTIMILVLSTSLSNRMSTLSSELAREKMQISGRVAMRDFAMMAQRAREHRVLNGACLPGTTDHLGLFCFPNDDNINFSDCIISPLTPDDPPIRLCLRGAPQHLRVSWLEDKLQWIYAAVNLLSNRAHAQAGGVERHRPNIVGAPRGRMLNPATCSAATGGDQYCKRCTNGPGFNLQNVICVTLEVCLRSSGVCNNDWVMQRIGIIDR